MSFLITRSSQNTSNMNQVFKNSSYNWLSDIKNKRKTKRKRRDNFIYWCDLMIYWEYVLIYLYFMRIILLTVCLCISWKECDLGVTINIWWKYLVTEYWAWIFFFSLFSYLTGSHRTNKLFNPASSLFYLFIWEFLLQKAIFIMRQIHGGMLAIWECSTRNQVVFFGNE